MCTCTGLLMYDGAPTIGEIDAALAASELGFRRQYCEWNRWTRHLREMNCLYSKPTSRWLWVTANAQGEKSIVSYDRALPNFLRWPALPQTLETSSFAGERIKGAAGHHAPGARDQSRAARGVEMARRGDSTASTDVGHGRSQHETQSQTVLGTLLGAGGRSSTRRRGRSGGRTDKHKQGQPSRQGSRGAGSA
uniref:Uncharacterized protein n=2 Tax=Haptolina brevifila TaxID=156173 RepID=A0A7S2J2G9_9EUKA|mmetsp:Transcript_74643/g.148338  ORF Transcript_74643/g.148338 Transcript_74643/m.148338 type:complete len:193 (+) Transcript_74643:20-598(+)